VRPVRILQGGFVRLTSEAAVRLRHVGWIRLCCRSKLTDLDWPDPESVRGAGGLAGPRHGPLGGLRKQEAPARIRRRVPSAMTG